MAAVSESQVVATELERVEPKIQVLFERDPGFVGSIKKQNVEVMSAREMRVPLEINPGGNFGYFNPDGGDLGRGSGPVWDKAVLSPVYMSLGTESPSSLSGLLMISVRLYRMQFVV